MTDGSTAAIRVAAFRQLANQDAPRALGTLKQIIAAADGEPAAPAIIRAAMETTDPVLGNYLVTNLATISPAGQQVILAAVMDDRQAAYEQPLLAFLPAATGAVRDSTIRALGLIGGEATFEALFALFLQDPNDTLTDTLAGLQVAAVDARLFKMLSNGADEAKQIAAIRMLAIRRPAGTLDTFHKLAAPGASEPIREAVFKELETAGNPASCQLLAAIVVQPDPLKRLAQQTLKRLSLNLGNADALWESAYQPALETAPNDAAREDLLAIIDGVAGTKSLAYLERPALDPAHPLHAAAVRSLSRWPDFAAGEIWLKLLATENLADDHLPAAEKGIIRIITQESITAPPRDKYDLAVRAIQAGPTAAIKEAILDRCESPEPQPQKTEFETAFSALLDDPDIGLQVYPLLGQTPPPPEPEPEPASPPAAE